jgi:CheY-like chemotaxis protein
MATKQRIRIDDESLRQVLLDDSDPMLYRILVVDRDPYVSMRCRLSLHGEGAVVFAAENQKEAVDKLIREEFDLVISDIMIPDVFGGFDFIKKAMKMQPWADIVITADNPSLWDARDSIKLGALKYIEKPLLFEYMKHIANKAFDKHGWILRKSHIDMFRYFIDTKPETDHPIYYKKGSWARPYDGGVWEIGFDLNCLPFSSQMPCCIHISEELSALKAGAHYARISTRAGEIIELSAPITGVINDVNKEIVNKKFSFSHLNQRANWQLKLAVVQT